MQPSLRDTPLATEREPKQTRMSRDLFPRENLLHCGISIRPLSALGLGRAKTPAPVAHVETSRRNGESWSRRCCARGVRYLVGELYFLHFAIVSVFTQAGSDSVIRRCRFNVRFARRRTWLRRATPDSAEPHRPMERPTGRNGGCVSAERAMAKIMHGPQ